MQHPMKPGAQPQRLRIIVCMQIAAVLSTALLVGWLTRRYVPVAAKAVYLIDTYTYKPPDRMKVSRENYIRGARMRKVRARPSVQHGSTLL